MKSTNAKTGEIVRKKIKLECHVVNDNKCIQLVHDIDKIWIYGTAIISQSAIERIRCSNFNEHSSVLTYYGNKHSDFRAYINRDYHNIGITN